MKLGVTPETGILEASFRVIVMFERAIPSEMTGPEPIMLEFAADTGPGANTTVPPAKEMGVTSERVFVSAVVEARLQVLEPLAFVKLQAP